MNGAGILCAFVANHLLLSVCYFVVSGTRQGEYDRGGGGGIYIIYNSFKDLKRQYSFCFFAVLLLMLMKPVHLNDHPSLSLESGTIHNGELMDCPHFLPPRASDCKKKKRK